MYNAYTMKLSKFQPKLKKKFSLKNFLRKKKQTHKINFEKKFNILPLLNTSISNYVF